MDKELAEYPVNKEKRFIESARNQEAQVINQKESNFLLQAQDSNFFLQKQKKLK